MGGHVVYDADGNASYVEDENDSMTGLENSRGAPPLRPADTENEIKNRIYALREVFWKYRFRLPTQAEFDRYAKSQGRLTPQSVWGPTLERFKTDPDSVFAIREYGNNKINTTLLPSGYGFAESEDVDPRATGEQKPPGDTTTVGAPNLNREVLLGQIRADAKKQGITLTPESEEYWIGKASKPDLYSDGKWRVGWNPYLASRLDGRASSDPRLAGDAGIVAAPAGYVGGGSSESGTASSAETPAARAARLATFGLGPEGLQNQRPGEMPTPPTLGDMMGQQGPIANPGTYTPGAAYQAPEYRAPDPYQQATPFNRPEYQAATPFVAPTAADMGQDPGYQFRLSEGQKALERSGAARGVTNTGGNMKGLLDYGQQAASQEYGNVYNRNLNTYNTNEANRAGAYDTNYGNALKAYDMNEANRLGSYNTNTENAYRQYTTNALANTTANNEQESRQSLASTNNSNNYRQQQMDAQLLRRQRYDDSVAAYQSGLTNTRNFERDRISDLFRVAGI